MTDFRIQFSADSRNLSLAPGAVTTKISHNYTVVPVADPVHFDGYVQLRKGQVYNLRLRGTVTFGGSIKVTFQQGNVFRDFAHFPDGAVDPAIGGITARTTGAAYDAAQPSNFKRLALSAVVGLETSYAKRVAFVAPGVRINALAPGEKVHIDATQVELEPEGATVPSAYAPARTLKVSVRPDRLNYAPGGFGPGVNTLSQWTLTRVTGATSSGFARFTVSDVTSVTAMAQRVGTTGAASQFPVLPGEQYTVSCEGRVSTTAYGLGLQFYWYDAAGALISSPNSDNQPMLTSDFRAMAYTATAPANAVKGAAQIGIHTGTRAANDTFDLRNVLIERAAAAGTFFDGASGADYLWEQGGTAQAARSYYYRDYAARSYLLKRTIAENCPLGVNPAVPQFAVLPKI